GVPLLHRLGPLAGPAAAIILLYTDLFLYISLTGTGVGGQFWYLTGVALTVLYFGSEYVALTRASAAIAAALIIVLQVTVPYDTGLGSASIFYMATIIIAAVCSGTLLLIVSYALREAARAEAVAEREHERSERLLANILPPAI